MSPKQRDMKRKKDSAKMEANMRVAFPRGGMVTEEENARAGRVGTGRCAGR
jgi:hypothetical protein